MPTTATQLVAAAKATIENLTVEQAAAEIADGALLVDLREDPERIASGAIPGSLHVPRGMLEFMADPSHALHLANLQPAQRTVLYCAAGSRSALAVSTLQQLGYSDVAHIDGGMQRCRPADRDDRLTPSVRGHSRGIPGEPGRAEQN
jgi:rhodanese-related sulfurtransferase